MVKILKILFLVNFCNLPFFVYGQNKLFIPPILQGKQINLTFEKGKKKFFSGDSTPTYGLNGNWMSPTLIFNKNDSVSFTIYNKIDMPTTLHWHGFHLEAKYDGGPHQVIKQNTYWKPNFKINNDAGTYWYHPHGDGKTDLQVSKGVVGMIIVNDTANERLNLPKDYGKDDYPIIIQSKAFDELNQIAIATEMDTSIFINGTLNPYLELPKQVVRLRLLNASSMRTYLLGFDGNEYFSIISSDDGLLDSSISMNRIRISPGERYDILINLNEFKNNTIYLRNFGSELKNGIYGSLKVGVGKDSIPEYSLNKLNGKDYNLLKINVVKENSKAIKTIPSKLKNYESWDFSKVTKTRVFNLYSDSIGSKAEGPFNIDNKKFDINTPNLKIEKNTFEIWTWINHTYVSHPIHKHDLHFYILDINKKKPLKYQQGKKDVVLVEPNDTVRFITKFGDFEDTIIPYMYHCHLLHHEDDGMMGSFLVVNKINVGIENQNISNIDFQVFPNPAKDILNVGIPQYKACIYKLIDMQGRILDQSQTLNSTKFSMNISNYQNGMYFIELIDGTGARGIKKWVKE